ncbi:MAG TPA: biotin-dependent carboxyltransferase family protein [Candidatus Dormibacteraeota bacterium]
MNALRVVDAGVRTLVVDTGRFGSARLGIPRSGAADGEALLLANALCGNPPGSAALEIAVRGPQLLVEAPVCRVALAGDAALRLERDRTRRELAPWRSHTLRRGDRLWVGATRHVLGAVLAIGGGVAVEPCLGSRSTSLRGGLPERLGRPLRAGDLLPLDAAAARRCNAPERALEVPVGIHVHPQGALRLLAGPQQTTLDPTGWDALTGAEWRVSASSDRTGLRLEGARLRLRGVADVPSQGCPAGAVQVSGDGAAIILGVDRGTTGGYCVAAVVASVDLPRLGRLRPGQRLQLELTDVTRALALLRRRAAELTTLVAACRPATLAPP